MTEERPAGEASPPESDPLDDFYMNLQNLVVDQAKRMINLSLYNRTLLSTLPVALLGTDEEGYIRSTNQAAVDILGFSEKELQDRLLVELFEPDSEPVKKIGQTVEEGRPFHMSAESLRLTSGKEIVGNLYFQPLRDEEEEVSGILLTVEDLTYFHYLQDAFKRYVPPSVSEIIAQDPQSLKLGGEEKVLTVLFSDLIGFSAISEQHQPHEMVEILSEYFTEMTNHVFAFQGTLKEYVGDELMAIFGAPVDTPDHAKKACAAALAMDENLRLMRESWKKIGRPALRARIGINSGPMLVGNLGSSHRFSYGVVGDQVNLASRLEGLSGIYGTGILIGENTANLLDDAFLIREVDLVRVKGRAQTVRIYELIAHAGTPLPEKRIASLEHYATGLEAYRLQKWETAVNEFQKAWEVWPKQNPARVMSERSMIYREASFQEEWDGVFDHISKK